MSIPETPAAAARYAHEFLVGSSLVENVVDAAGEYDAKTDPEETTSLAAHLLNAMTIGVNTFVYSAVNGGRDITELEEELRVLASALVLHDTNKYVQEAYGIKSNGNTREVFETYFNEGDDFGVEGFLGDGYRDDLLYLVQRTELTEDSRETRGTDTEFVGLDRYCRLGDQVASVILREGVESGYKAMAKKLDDEEIHLLELNAVEQPVLNDELIGRTKEVISGEDGGEEVGVVVGSTPDRVLYLGTDIDRDELRERVHAHLSTELIESGRYSFSCKLGWNSFDYDILAEFALNPEQKEQIIAEEFRELLHDGKAGVEAFERIPEDFDQYFAILAKAMYIDRQSEFEDPGLQEAYDEVLEIGRQKVKIHYIAHLIRNFNEHQNALDNLAEKLRPELHSDLEPENDEIDTVVNRFFDATITTILPEKENMCFFCGSTARTEYKKGQEAIIRTQEFSRRVPPRPKQKYKSICGVCNLEYALFSEYCKQSNVNLRSSIDVAYYYFDDFLGDIRLRGGRMGVEPGESLDLSDSEIVKNLIRPQYYIQPFEFGGRRNMSDKNHRMVVVRQLMQRAQAVGMKVVLGRPFTRFESADEAFVDEDAIREQEALGLDSAARFGPLPPFIDSDDRPESHLRRALALHKLIATVGYEAGMNNPYLQLDRDTFHSLTDFAVRNHDNATRLPELRSYLETYHSNQLMDMKTVARRGVDLFGKQFDSKYKKTKIFREAIDSFLSGKNQRMSEEDLLEYVEAQVYTAADREDYAGYTTPEQAEAFVDAVRSYLVENDLYTLKKLSDWENALVNSYLYAYEQVLNEDTKDDAETEEAATN
ncbi:hypothetical protein BG842_13935 [Haladaptatus sp. W1]|uniref:hypothetical protein n=1 Tax=Haladaptatus sp. W1 TaxID=1897478 RepID=UPI0008497BF7|nr:hypothetical protein [Haladaptatus sp. W1]ODR80894.1 hypothetical protein BG842_13935 [Haladaptatus sp. W1]